MKRILFAQSTKKKLLKRVATTAAALCTFGLIACSTIQRSPSSGYADTASDSDRSGPRSEWSERRRDPRLDAAAEKLGYDDLSNLSESELRRVHQRAELERAEQAIVGRRERDQYFQNKPYFKNDRDRLAFLAGPDFESREKWLDTHHIDGPSTQTPSVYQKIVDQNDVALGMTKTAVRDSWGPPDSVEVAGNPMYQNERWLYTEQTASTEGYRNEKRSIYFEGGVVVGWETR